ncbi:hypothetical protein, partial [Niveispirillum sp.]|uniref:hypothetical protein n=1 Tax=Niveispirillum sp. TaxID=1917217 RepID=UPI001B68CCBA
MLRLLLTPLRWFFRFVLYAGVVVTLLVLLAPFAFDIPGRAEQVLASMNDGAMRGIRVRALPDSVSGFPPELEIRDLQILVAGGSATAMTAAKVRIGVNAMESVLRGRVVLVAMVENPVIYANQPLNLGVIAAAIGIATGLQTQIQLIGGEVITPGSPTVIALGDDTRTNINTRSSDDQQVAEAVAQDDRGTSGLGGGSGAGTTAAGVGGVVPGIGAGVVAGVGGAVTGSGGGRGPGTSPGGGGTNPGGGGTNPGGGGTNPGGGGTNPGGGGTNPGGGGTNPGGGGTNPGGGGTNP